MKSFYKIVNLKAQVGSGTVIPQGFTEYTIGQEPQVLIDGLTPTSEQLTYENNVNINAQITSLELSLSRPMRELLSGMSTVTDKEIAQTKVDDVEGQIQTLRGQLQ